MFTRILSRISSIALGVALLTAGLFFDGATATSINQQATPTSTLSPSERLLKPTLPPEPSQADLGAQDYWLYCLPCHGERGQGLTQEFRETYPPEEVDCWQSGCHGKTPYEDGFILPTKVPAVVEHSALAKFSDASQLNAYIRATMPFWNPGSLTEEEAWRVTAFILRQNNLWNGTTDLGPSNASGVKIPRAAFLTPAVTSQPVQARESNGIFIWLALVGVVVLLFLLMFILKKNRNTTTI
ncbi:MAG TPA: c-type cytochrome [Anaerolineales bacterium]|nr:c-type cytochrome [Anaerolineales bacterium]